MTPNSFSFGVRDASRAPTRPGRSETGAYPFHERPDPVCVSPCAGQDADLFRLAEIGLAAGFAVHDLGNHLQVIASAVRLIQKSLGPGADEGQRALTGAALASIDRAAAVRRHVLDSAGSVSPEPEIAFLDTVIGAMKDVIILAAGPMVDVSFRLDPTAPPVVCDLRLLENAILNLVVNARHAMPAGGRLLVSTFHEVALAADDVQDVRHSVVSVMDTGCGMTALQVKEAFRPFVTRRSVEGGLGLGLAMVGDFVRRAGGAPVIVSTPGKGTTVYLRFPGCGV